VIELFDFQYRAVAQMTDRFAHYWANRPGRILGTKTTYVPFYQALASITASGKTVIMAQTASELLPLLPLKPVVIWVSKGRVVVDQTYTNLQDAGKYRHLLAGFEIRLLGEYDQAEIDDESLAVIYIATVGTFNQKDKDAGKLKLFKSEIDNADRSTWDALQLRLTSAGTRRPLLIVYDEAHNLTDQQTNLLMELEPDALLLASATPRLPQAIARITDDLKRDLKWTDADLTTYVSSKDVVDSGLVKRFVRLGGYQAQMAETIDDLLDDMATANTAVTQLGLPITPKAIYVCRTNIVEGNANEQDDPKRPFAQRQAPPILIWNYLVNEKGVDPSTIATYTSALKFDKDHPPPAEFVHFKGGDSDYASFLAGGFRHIIFNLGLQEGWDDPECYFAYIDKSMQSTIQVEQVIGRVLRQPGAYHYESEPLNTANFYVRVDAKTVFVDIVKEIAARLAADLPEVLISSYEAGKRNKPVPLPPKKRREVPHVYRDPTAAQEPIDEVIRNLIDFRNDTGPNVRGTGAKALVQQRVGAPGTSEVEWVEREHGNAVSARWIFQTAVRRVFPLALEVTRSDDPKFDAKIELQSPADDHMRKAAEDVVQIYLEHVVLKQRLPNPFVVGDILVDPTKAETFKHALHDAYSGLNKSLELPFARELDKLRLTWCRNPSRSGFAIPLLSPGASKSFYPDFLVWKGKDVFALDTTGEHILESKLGRKLLAVEPHPRAKTRLLVRLISSGHWTDQPQRESAEGFTVWSLGHANALRPVHVGSMAEAIAASLRTLTDG
jgi:type III restriction enzyme